jgi:hypothetical protein
MRLCSMTIHVRVCRVAIKSVFPPDKTYMIAIGSLPRGKARTVIATLTNFDLTTGAVWSLSRDASQDDKLWIGLFQQNSFIGETKLASVVIPIEWLPVDRVVKVTFPLRLSNDDWDRAIPALVKLHYATNSAARFRAPRGELTVKPAWGMKQPKQKEKEKTEEPEPAPPPPTTVMIPRPVYEHVRALQRQVAELQRELAQQRTQTHPSQSPEEPALEVIAEEPTRDVIEEEPTTEVTAEEPIPEVIAEEPTTEVTAEESTRDVIEAELTTEVTAEEPIPEVIAEEPTGEVVAAEVIAEEPTPEGIVAEPARRVTAEEPTAEVPVTELMPPSEERPVKKKRPKKGKKVRTAGEKVAPHARNSKK